jgi:hypothetical protein
MSPVRCQCGALQHDHPVYLGDSVYVRVYDGMLQLTTENGLPTDPSNVIFMEREVWDALRTYVDHLEWT